MNTIVYAQDILHFDSQEIALSYFEKPSTSASAVKESMSLQTILLISLGLIISGILVYSVIAELNKKRAQLESTNFH